MNKLITGVVTLSSEIASKRLELLHKAQPATQSIAFLTGPADSRLSQVALRHPFGLAPFIIRHV
jgi:hypothetical protein